jgi:cytochrome P450
VHRLETGLFVDLRERSRMISNDKERKKESAMERHDDARPTIALDFESPEHAAGWEARAEDLRSRCPFAWATDHGGHWIASRYKDIVRIVQDDGVFSTAKTFDPETMHVDGGVAIPPMPVGRLVPAETDRPEWDVFRGLLNPRLGPRAAEGFRERAKGYARALLDQVIETGRMDTVDQFTNPLTAMVTLDVLGFPLSEWRTFGDPLHALTSLNKGDPAYAGALELAAIMDRRIDEEIELRRRERIDKDDIIGHLLRAEVDGQPLAHADIHQVIFNVIAGGVDTTTALTSSVIVHLWKHPEQRERLRTDRSLLPYAREEMLRFFSPLHGTVRTALSDSEVGGHPVAEGERIYIFLASANRDPEMFENPDEVVLDRFPNRHIAFSAGIHRCVGSFLAKMMFEVMIEEILDRIPDYEVLIEGAHPYPSISPVNGWVDIPIRFTPGKRSGTPVPEWLSASVK